MGKVSLITPVFNVSENLLDRCAKSVLGQYDVDWEWLLIDDGSESDCAEYLDALTKHDCRIRVFHQKIVALPKLGIKAFCTLVEHMLYSLIVMMH